jgi:hypothetical protein
LRCDEVQGHLIGPAMSADAFALWLQERGDELAGGPLRPADALTAA